MAKKYHFILYCTALSVLVTTGFVTKNNSAIAQQQIEERSRNVIEEIVVIESPVLHRQVERADMTGRVIETITLKRHVSHVDLDLSKYADVIELKSRIEINSKEVCEVLDELVRIPQWGSANIANCIQKAIGSADDALREAIAAAE